VYVNRRICNCSRIIGSYLNNIYFNKIFCTISPYLQHYSMKTGFLIRTILVNSRIYFYVDKFNEK
jgi:hypothetical protein